MEMVTLLATEFSSSPCLLSNPPVWGSREVFTDPSDSISMFTDRLLIIFVFPAWLGDGSGLVK